MKKFNKVLALGMAGSMALSMAAWRQFLFCLHRHRWQQHLYGCSYGCSLQGRRHPEMGGRWFWHAF